MNHHLTIWLCLQSIPFTVYFVLTVLIAPGCFSEQETISLDPNDYPYEFLEQRIEQTVKKEYHFVDLDGDLVDEKIVVSYGTKANESLILITTHDERVFSQINLPPTSMVTFSFADYVDGDRNRDLFVVSKEVDTIFARVIDVYTSRTLKKFPLFWKPDSLERLPEDVGVEMIGLIRTETSPRAVLCVFTSSSRNMSFAPRGMAAFDVENGNRLWYFAMGAWPNKPTLKDVTGDDIPEIFVPAGAPGNGASANGIDDSHSYLISLDANGKKVWSKQLGGIFSRPSAFLADLDLDGEDEIICTFTSANKVAEKSYVALFNALTGRQIGKKELGVCPSNSFPHVKELVSDDVYL